MMTQEPKGRAQPIASAKGYGRGVVTGVIIGLLLQLMALSTRLDGFGTIVGIFLLVIGILAWRSYPPKSPPPSPHPPINPTEEERARYRGEVGIRQIRAIVDFTALGGTMLVIEVIAIALYILFGFHFPLAPGVH